jgi:hypothetical protein
LLGRSLRKSSLGRPSETDQNICLHILFRYFRGSKLWLLLHAINGDRRILFAVLSNKARRTIV